LKERHTFSQGIAGLDWIGGLTNPDCNLFVIDNPIQKSRFGFSIQQFQFNPNPKKIRIINFFISQLHSSFSKPSHFLLTVLKKFGLSKSPLGLEIF